jgi:hypothetical protein
VSLAGNRKDCRAKIGRRCEEHSLSLRRRRSVVETEVDVLEVKSELDVLIYWIGADWYRE